MECINRPPREPRSDGPACHAAPQPPRALRFAQCRPTLARGSGVQFLECVVLDLANTLGTDAEAGCDLAKRLRRAAETVARADHDPLPLAQVGEQIGNRFGQLALVNTLIRVLGRSVGE